MARKGRGSGGGATKWLWYGAAAVVGYVVLDKLGIIDQVRSQLGGIGGAAAGTAAANVARINYAYSSNERDRLALNTQYPEQMGYMARSRARAYSSNERDRQWLNMQYPEQMAYIGNAYGQGSQSMSGEYNTIPFALS